MEQFFVTTQSDTVAQAKVALPEWSVPDFLNLPDTVASTVGSAITRAESAESVFSSGSILNPQVVLESSDVGSGATYAPIEWQVTILLLALLGYYLFVLYRFRTSIGAAFRTFFSVPQTISAHEFKTNDQIIFGKHSVVLFMLALTVTATEYAGIFFSLPQYLVFSIFLGSVVALMLYKALANHALIAFSEDKTPSDIIKLHSHHVSLAAIIYTPVAIASMAEGSGSIVFISVLILLWIYYFARLFSLFIRDGFGKLQWILYICTVEILPLSLIWALAVRY